MREKIGRFLPRMRIGLGSFWNLALGSKILIANILCVLATVGLMVVFNLGVLRGTTWFGGFLLVFAVTGALFWANLRFARKTSGGLANVMGSTKTESDSLKDLSVRLGDLSATLARSSENNAISIEEITSHVGSFDDMLKGNVERANNAANVAGLAKGKSDQGAAQMKNLLESIAAVNESSKMIGEFKKVFAEITAKTKIIDEIVFQTRLLSFNASIEAARAGEHGKGFSVVAEEVGSLAKMSGLAAKEISSMLDKSLSVIAGIVDEVMAATDRSNGIALHTAKCFGEINEHVNIMAEFIAQNANANSEQWRGLKKITDAIKSIDMATASNLQAVRDMDGMVMNLSMQAEVLNDIIKGFSGIIFGLSSGSGQAPPASMAQRDGKSTGNENATFVSGDRAA